METNHDEKVWDPLVRVFHWALVLSFVVAYVTEDEQLDLHVQAGYTVGALVAFRLLWGFIGTMHARFSDFVFSPITVIAYLKDMLAFSAKRYIGHNPAGGAMVVALLFALTATTVSGLQLYAVEKGKGPLASVELDITLVATARADDDDDEYEDDDDEHKHEGGDELWEELHEFFADLTLLLVLLHVAGVFVSSFAHSENLPRAMITGRKRRED